MNSETLQMVKCGDLRPKEAYRMLYPDNKPKRLRRAWFIKLRINIPKEKGVNRFLAVLFFLPFPIFLAKLALRFVKNDSLKDSGLTTKDIMNIISYRGIKVEVMTSDNTNILIKTI